MKNLTNDLIEKARLTKSAEELYALAKAGGVEITEAEAVTYFAQLNDKGEVEDDELAVVAGGKCGTQEDEEEEGIKTTVTNSTRFA